MNIKKIKGNGVAIVDEMRRSIAFTSEQRRRMERIYKAIRNGKVTAIDLQ